MITTLDNISLAESAKFGGKAEGLGRLAQCGAPIPQTLCIAAATEDMDSFARDSALISSVTQWVARQSSADSWIVRSSHLEEDSQAASFAGLFPSRVIQTLGAEPTTDVISTAADVLTILLRSFSPAAVIVQPFIKGTLSGVLFTSDPNVGRKGEGLINFVEGPCAALVDGTGIPQSVSFSVNGGHVELPSPLADRFDELTHYCSKVEERWGVPIDSEFTIDERDRLVILQARPIAALTIWNRPNGLASVQVGGQIPASIEGRPKIQLRLTCEKYEISISQAWIATETRWQKLEQFALPDGCYTSVLLQPHLLNGKIRRMFSQDGFSGASTVLADAHEFWVRHAIVAEVLPADLTGIASKEGNRTIVEVAKGHFVPKGVVDTAVYELEDDEARLVHFPRQLWFYDINPETGEAEKHEWDGQVQLDINQLRAIQLMLERLSLDAGGCLEFGVLKTGEVYVIDIQKGSADAHLSQTNRQVISLGESEGKLVHLEVGLSDATEGHFFEFAALDSKENIGLKPVIIWAQRPELGLLTEFERLYDEGKRIVGAIFEVYSPLSHLSILLREKGIPTIVIPDFTQSDCAQATVVQVSASPEGGKVTRIE